MRQIDREGIFRAIPREWWVRTTENSRAVAVTIDSDIVEQFNGSGWDDWSQYEQHTVIGDWWVIGKDGTINTTAIEQLASSLGWDGNLDSIQATPPRVVVQLTVKPDVYQNKTRYKAAWMNPGDFTPRSGATSEQVTKLTAQFGSLLRAAAAGAAKAAKPVSAPKRKVDESPLPEDAPVSLYDQTQEPPPPGDADIPGVVHPDSTGDDVLPFR